MSHSRIDDQSQVNVSKPWWAAIASAALGGAAGAAAAYPFEGLKKSVQSGLITGLRPALKLFFQPRELYRGTSAFAGSLIPTTIIQMSLQNYFDSLALSDTDKQASVVLSGASGAFASAAAEKLILTQRYLKMGPSDAVKYVVKNQGFFALWHGFTPLAIREAVFGACMLKFGQKANAEFGFAGTIGVGFAGAVISHPFDAIATQMQLSTFANNANGETKPVTAREVAKKIIKEQGVKSLYKGLGWRLGLFTTCMVTIPKASTAIDKVLDSVYADDKKPCLSK